MTARHLRHILLLALAYVVAARLGLLLDAVSGFATLVWAPSGIALASLLVGGRRLWPGVFLGAFIANFSVGAPLVVALGIAGGNTLEGLVGLWLLTRGGVGNDLARVRDMIAFLVLAVIGSTVVSAAIGTTSLSLGGAIAPGGAGATFSAWWAGDACGELMVTPLLLSCRPPLGRLRLGRLVEAAALLAALVGVSLLIFGGLGGGMLMPYLLSPCLIWAALRFELRGITGALAVAASVAIVGTARGAGPFAGDSLHQSLLELQIFMAVNGVGGLLLASSVAELRRTGVELQRALGIRDEFVSVAAHELRTPLTALLLTLQSLHLEPAMPMATGHTVDRAIAIGERLARLIDGLLDVSRLNSGRLILELEPMDLSALVREVSERFLDAAARQRTSLVLALDPELRGRWDRFRLDQVMSNLVTNAMKYGAGKPVTLRLRRDGDAAVLDVADQGIGVAAEDQVRIFERFERAAPSKQYGGLGLGLYIARRIVEAHGGRLTLVSRPGEGSTFTVSLPITP